MKERISDCLEATKVVAIIRGQSPEVCVKLAGAYREGGIRLVEVTFVPTGDPAGTVAATLNSGSTVLLEDYWKRFCPARANERSNLRFLRTMTAVLAVVSIGISLAVVWSTTDMTILSAWWLIQDVFSGGMLGLFLLSLLSRRSNGTAAATATVLALLTVLYITFGQRVWPLPVVLHTNLSIVLGTLVLVVSGFVLGIRGKGRNR